MMKKSTVIQVFCKTPILGTVKTRLTPELSPQEALAVHKTLSQRTFDLVLNNELGDVQIWCSPSKEHEFFADYADIMHEQQGDDLGERMANAIAVGLVDYQAVILIGCDCPSLTKQDLTLAVQALQSNAEVVLAPAEDGGYVLIGLTSNQPQLFMDMPWGSSQVLRLTRERIAALNLKCVELAEQWDVDFSEDLQRYFNLVSSGV